MEALRGKQSLTLMKHSPEFKEKKFLHSLKMTVGFPDLLLTFSISQQFKFSISRSVNHASVNIVSYVHGMFSWSAKSWIFTSCEWSKKSNATRHSWRNWSRYYVIAWVIECTISFITSAKLFCKKCQKLIRRRILWRKCFRADYFQW